MVTSENQVRQLYVATSLLTAAPTSASAVGAIYPKSDSGKTHLYFQHVGKGGLVRSDLIDIANIMNVKVTDAASLKEGLVKYKVTLDSSPVAGQDYQLRVAFEKYIGMSNQDQTFKFGVVHASTGMSVSDFYKKMVISLVQNFTREESQLLKFYIGTASAETEVTKDTKISALTGTYTYIALEEAPQDWVLGRISQERVYFVPQPDEINDGSDMVIWGSVTKMTPANFILNGHKMADLEYFCMGERGDFYRNVGFPKVIKTDYLVNPENQYNLIDITYNYIGNGISVQKSQKTLTILVPKVGTSNSVNNALTKSISDAIATATGLTIPTVSVTD